MPDWIFGLVAGVVGGTASQLVGHFLSSRQEDRTIEKAVRSARQREVRANVDLLMERIRSLYVAEHAGEGLDALVEFDSAFADLNRISLALSVIPDAPIRQKVHELQDVFVGIANAAIAVRNGETSKEEARQEFPSFADAADLYVEIVRRMDELGYALA